MTPWTVACQAPLSMGLQEYWTGLPFPPPGNLSDPGIELASPALAGGFFTSEPPRKPFVVYHRLWKIRFISEHCRQSITEVNSMKRTRVESA